SRRWSSPPRRSSPAATRRRRRAPRSAPWRSMPRPSSRPARRCAPSRSRATARRPCASARTSRARCVTRWTRRRAPRWRAWWSAVAGLVATGLGDAPGLASAPAPALASLGALDPDLGTRFQGSRGEPAMHIAQAFTAAVIAAAGERPLLLVVDDAQWLDALSLTLLPALARDTAAHRVLLLLGVARGWPDGERFDALRGRLGRDLEGAVIRLERLDQAALGELVAWAVPSYSADEHDRLVRRAGPGARPGRPSPGRPRVGALAQRRHAGLRVRRSDRARHRAAGDAPPGPGPPLPGTVRGLKSA